MKFEFKLSGISLVIVIVIIVALCLTFCSNKSNKDKFFILYDRIDKKYYEGLPTEYDASGYCLWFRNGKTNMQIRYGFSLLMFDDLKSKSEWINDFNKKMETKE